MAKHELELVEMTNMCMIQNEITKEVLVQIRNKNDWDGLSFPGGHIELGEPIVPSVKREVKEETGLIVDNLIPCGIKDWYDYKKQKRYIVFFYKTTTYTGELLPQTHEGENRWITIDEILSSDNIAADFLEMLNIFLGTTTETEFFYEDNQNPDENKRWTKKFY